MAFDGVTVAAMISELNKRSKGGRIVKIAQPEQDEILLSIKTEEENLKLLLSASASLPLLYLTEENKPSPQTAPNFCMVLRKHLQGGRIQGFYQQGLERAVEMRVEHLNEMGDLCTRCLILEIMGKHSNLILTDDNNVILDSLKHVGFTMSSLREVLPGRNYFIPRTEEKENFLAWNKIDFKEKIIEKAKPLYQAVYTTFTGFSPFLSQEVCFEAGVDSNKPATVVTEEEYDRLFRTLLLLKEDLDAGKFYPRMLMENGMAREFSVVRFSSYDASNRAEYDSVSELIYDFYSRKSTAQVMKQKAYDLTRVLKTALERDYKKLELQQKQMEDSREREKFRLYGELLNAYQYQLPNGEKKVEVQNYHTNENIVIPLNDQLGISENAKRYFDKYAKLKRTDEALGSQIEETKKEIEFLESIKLYLKLASSESELSELREELYRRGFIHKKASKKEKRKKTKPKHYRFMNTYDIYVGKNNLQNEELTFQIATGNDWWFHAKGVPGSHVLVRAPFENQAVEWDMPDEVFEAAAALAARNSQNGEQGKVDVDYVRKKKVKKPAGGGDGYVIYHSNFSMTISPDVERFALTEIDK